MPALRWGGLAATAGAAVVLDAGSAFPGAVALWPVLGACALLVAGTAGPTDACGRALHSKPMQTLGRLSYGWYLWHWPVLIYSAVVAGPLHWSVAMLVSAGSLVLAELTYRLLEDPVRRAPVLIPRPLLSLGLALTLALATIGASAWSRSQAIGAMAGQAEITRAATDWPAVYDDGCHLQFTDVESPPCAFGNPAADTTIVLFGDSHAMQWFPALERIARERSWRLVSLTKAACPSADVVVQQPVLKRRYVECERWRANALRRITGIRPAAVVTSNSRWYLTHVPPEEWGAGLERTLATLAARGIPTLLLQDTPRPGFNVPTCLALVAPAGRRDADGACRFPRLRPRDEVGSRLELAAAAAVPGVVIADLSPVICGGAEACDAMRDGEVLYIDHDHITATYAASLTPLIEPRLRAAIRLDAAARWPDRP